MRLALKTRHLRAAFAAFFVFLLFIPSLAFSQETPSEGLPLPDVSLSTKDDASSIETNPAGLGFMRGAELGYAFYFPKEDLIGVVPEGQALFLAYANEMGGMGLGVQWIRRPNLGGRQQNYRKYTLALGKAFGNFSFGTGIHAFGSAHSKSLDDLIAFDMGAQWRLASWFGLGLQIRDINRPFLTDTEALPVQIGFSGALRVWEGRFIFENSVGLDSFRRDFQYSPRVVIEALSGFRVFSQAKFSYSRAKERGEFNALNIGLSLNTSLLGFEMSSKFSDLSGSLSYEGSGGYFWMSPNKQRPLFSKSRWVLIDMNQKFDEQRFENTVSSKDKSFLDLIRTLDEASKDPAVEGVVLPIGQADFDWAQAWELRQALEEIRKSGKQTIAFLSNPNFRQYYIASATDKIWLTPDNTFSLGGLSSTTFNIGDALKQAGIEAQFIRIGSYKSSPEMFTHAKPSKESEEARKAYLDIMYEEAIRGISESRKMSVEEVKKFINSDGFFPDEALQERWVDKLVYNDEADGIFYKEISHNIDARYPSRKTREERWNSNPIIAVVAIDGDIVSGTSTVVPFLDQKTVGHKSVLQTLIRLQEDVRVKGVVLRINSPGGSAAASDRIYRAIRKLARFKPVVASMGGVAASGGYYIAAGADEIFATPTTITGSIGIFTGNFNAAPLMQKLGVEATTYTKGNPLRFSFHRPWSEHEISKVKKNLNYLYRLFLTQVSATRSLDIEALDRVARGRVWAGKDAKRVKLVDRIGGISDAIHRVEELAGLLENDTEVVQYGMLDVGILDSIIGGNIMGASSQAEVALFRTLLVPFKDALGILLRYDSGEALMLFNSP